MTTKNITDEEFVESLLNHGKDYDDSMELLGCLHSSSASYAETAVKAAAVGDLDTFRKALDDMDESQSRKFVKGRETYAEQSVFTNMVCECLRKTDSSFIQALIDKGFDPNAKVSGNWTSVHFAASIGGVECLKALIEAGGRCDFTQCDDVDHVPLAMAAFQGNSEAFEFLLKLFPQALTFRNSQGKTALHHACGRLADETMRLLAKTHQTEEAVRIQDENGETPIHEAAKLSQSNHLRILLEAFPDFVQAENSTSILRLAAENDSLPSFMTLLEFGADPNLPISRPDDKTIAAIAASKGNSEMLAEILSRCRTTDLKTQTAQSAISDAALCNTGEECVSMLIDAGASYSELQPFANDSVKNAYEKAKLKLELSDSLFERADTKPRPKI